MEFLALVWIVSWIATIIISSKKGEGCISVITGFLFGPIALIFAILSTGNKIKCPYCRELIEKNALICPHCHSNLQLLEKQVTFDEFHAKVKSLDFDNVVYKKRIKKHKQLLFYIFIPILVIILSITIYTTYNKKNDHKNTIHQSAQLKDDIDLFISKYGEPDKIISSEFEIPRPIIVTKQLVYLKENVRATYIPDVSINSNPPYSKWKLLGFQNRRTNKVISSAEVVERLKKRMIK